MNYAKYHAVFEKIAEQAKSDAEAILNARQEEKKFFGDETCAKIRKHDGSTYYMLSEEAFEEMLCWKLKQEAAMSCILYSKSMQNLSKKDYSAIEYVSQFTVKADLYESMIKAYKGTFLADFYRDKAEQDRLKAVEDAKTELFTKRWGF